MRHLCKWLNCQVFPSVLGIFIIDKWGDMGAIGGLDDTDLISIIMALQCAFKVLIGFFLLIYIYLYNDQCYNGLLVYFQGIDKIFFFIHLQNAVSMLKQEYKEGETNLQSALQLAIKVLSKTLDMTKITSEKGKMY